MFLVTIRSTLGFDKELKDKVNNLLLLPITSVQGPVPRDQFSNRFVELRPRKGSGLVFQTPLFSDQGIVILIALLNTSQTDLLP